MLQANIPQKLFDQYHQREEIKMTMKHRNTEYVIKAEKQNGEEVFVPQSHQSDIHKALIVYNVTCNSLDTKTRGLTVTMQKRQITTTVEDYTDVADDMLGSVNDYVPFTEQLENPKIII
jgi:hypothetical protein